MQTLDHDSVSMHIEAPADEIYELVADVTRTPEFSPEILRCKWLDGATGPVVGARFAARNKVPRRPAWTNKPVVTVVEPGQDLRDLAHREVRGDDRVDVPSSSPTVPAHWSRSRTRSRIRSAGSAGS